MNVLHEHAFSWMIVSAFEIRTCDTTLHFI